MKKEIVMKIRLSILSCMSMLLLTAGLFCQEAPGKNQPDATLSQEELAAHASERFKAHIYTRNFVQALHDLPAVTIDPSMYHYLKAEYEALKEKGMLRHVPTFIVRPLSWTVGGLKTFTSAVSCIVASTGAMSLLGYGKNLFRGSDGTQDFDDFFDQAAPYQRMTMLLDNDRQDDTSVEEVEEVDDSDDQSTTDSNKNNIPLPSANAAHDGADASRQQSAPAAGATAGSFMHAVRTYPHLFMGGAAVVVAGAIGLMASGVHEVETKLVRRAVAREQYQALKEIVLAIERAYAEVSPA